MKPGKTHSREASKTAGVSGLDPVADLGDHAVLEKDVEAAVAAGRRVHQPPAAQEQPAHASPSQGWPPSSR